MEHKLKGNMIGLFKRNLNIGVIRLSPSLKDATGTPELQRGAVALATFSRYVVLKAYVSNQNIQRTICPMPIPLAIIPFRKLGYVLTFLTSSREPHHELE